MKTFTLTSTSRARAAAFAAVAVTGSLFLSAPALADGSAGQHLGIGSGYNNVFTDSEGTQHGAGSIRFEFEGTEVVGYCVELGESIDTNGTYTSRPMDGSGISNAGQAAWLAINHETVGTPLADMGSENAATQVAIWALTDGAIIDGTSVTSPSIRARAAELVAAAAGNAVNNAPATFELVLAGDTTQTEATFTATFTNDAGVPFEGETLTFTLPDGSTTTAVTDGSGKASVKVPAPAADQTVEASVSWAGTLPAGVLIAPADDADQMAVTATSADITRSAEASVTGVSAPVSTTVPQTPPSTDAPQDPSPPASVPGDPTPPAGDPDPELPHTGGTFGLDQLLLGLGALGGSGGAAVHYLRKRRG